jgi:hypothetical protein
MNGCRVFALVAGLGPAAVAVLLAAQPAVAAVAAPILDLATLACTTASA